MKKLSSVINVVEVYEYEFIKESLSQFLTTLCSAIKNRLGKNVVIKAELTGECLYVSSETPEVSITNECVDNTNARLYGAVVTYKYAKDNKICEKVIVEIK